MLVYLLNKKSKVGYLALWLMVFMCSSSPLYANNTTAIKTRHIAMISFENAVLLDIVGPLTVFSAANMFISKEKKSDEKAYAIEILSEKKGPVHTYSGMVIMADRSYHSQPLDIDTLLIAGGPGVQQAGENKQLIGYLKHMNGKVRRLASICGGSFILAKAGLLKGKKATTHWNAISDMAESFPDIRVEKDINYIRDGHIYTSGGVMNGVQLALALVQEDYGRQIALKVAALIEVTYEH